MSLEDPRPAAPSAESIAEDLAYSNEISYSWFNYKLSEDKTTLIAQLYDDEGDVEKKFTIRLTIEEAV